MTRVHSLRHRLSAPLVYLAALVLLLEQWTWKVGARIAAVFARLPPLRALEALVRRLPPYPALCVFALPVLLLLPVKLLALMAIARGFPVSGIAGFVLAKLGGAVIVTRLYTLTLPALLTLGWFARWHNPCVIAKDRWIARLRASRAYRRASLLVRSLRRRTRRLLRRLGSSVSFGDRHASHSARVLRRLAALWRARHR
jgi:hypothetical protein